MNDFVRAKLSLGGLNSTAVMSGLAGFALTVSFLATAAVATNPFMDPNTGQSTHASCQGIQNSQISAVQGRLKAISQGMSVDSRKYFDPNAANSCLTIISGINLDLSYLIDPTGWANAITAAADALINQLKSQVCNLASNSINDVLGRYNNVIGQVNGFDMNSYLQGQFQTALTQTQANASAFIAANAPNSSQSSPVNSSPTAPVISQPAPTVQPAPSSQPAPTAPVPTGPAMPAVPSLN